VSNYGENEPTQLTPITPPVQPAQPTPAVPPTYPTPAPVPYAGVPTPTSGYPVPGYPGTAPLPYAARNAAPSRANVAGILVSAIGIAVVLLGMWLPWYADGGQKVKFTDIVKTVKLPGAKSLPHGYFQFGIWFAIAVALLLCLLANMGFASAVLRFIGPLVAVLGAALVLSSLSSMRDGHGSIFDHASAGLWLVLLGFVVAAVGGLLGDRRVPATA
jgi:hypothetical protein